MNGRDGGNYLVLVFRSKWSLLGDNPLSTTMLLDLSGRNSILAHFNAVQLRFKRVLVSSTDADIRFKSSMKARTGGRATPLLVSYPGVLSAKTYSITTLMAEINRMILTVHPAKIPL